MKTPHPCPAARALLLWLALAGIYSLWFQQRQSLTGDRTVDGAVSMLFGLFICSRPAGNAIDLLFSERYRFQRLASEWKSLGWLGLNILTLLMGWVVIYLGTSQLTSRGGE